MRSKSGLICSRLTVLICIRLTVLICIRLTVKSIVDHVNRLIAHACVMVDRR